MTRAELRSEVTFRIGRTDINSQINQRLQWAIDAIVKKVRPTDAKWRTAFTLVDGQADYGLPDYFLAPLAVMYLEDRVRLWPLHTYDQVAIDETQVGAPRRFWIIPDDSGTKKVSFYPSPGSAEDGKFVRMIYLRQLVLGTADESTSPLPPQYDEVVVEGACYRIYRDMNEVERAGDAYRTFRGLMKEAIKEDEETERNYGGHAVRVYRPQVTL